MRTAPVVFVAAMALAASVHSQVTDAIDSREPAPVTARLLDSIPDGTPPPPAPPKPSFVVPAKDVISTKTVQQEGRIITIQRIKPIALPPPPAPAAPPTAEESAAAAQRAAAFRAAHPGENFLQLGASVYLSENHPPRAFVRLWPQDGGEAITFWSNADFRLIAGGLGRFADSTGQRHRLFLMWSVIHTDRTATLRAAHGLTYQPPAFPAFPGEDSSAPFDPAAVPGPVTFVITGDATPTPAQLAAIDALHQVYNTTSAAASTRPIRGASGLASRLPVEDPFISVGNETTYCLYVTDLESRFWCIKIEDVDSDGDGLTNWEEYLLGSQPFLADTSGDGVPDLWLAVHGFDPTQHHGSILFPGSTLTVVQAYQLGVQARATATPDDLDGDGLANAEDADPEDSTVTWLKSPTPAWLLRFPDIPEGFVFCDISPAGTALFWESASGVFLVVTPDLQTHQFPDAPPGNSLGFYGLPLSRILHGDQVLGKRLVEGGTPGETEWAFYDPINETVVSAGIPVNNPPEAIWYATAAHVCAVGGFPVLFGSSYGPFEANENAVTFGSQGNGPTYWTYGPGGYDSGRPVPVGIDELSLDNRSATLNQLRSGQPSLLIHHLVPTRRSLFAAQGNQPFLQTKVLQAAVAPWWNTWATNQGWLVNQLKELWWNGNSVPLADHLPRRNTDGAAIELHQVHTARDTGVIVASAHYPGNADKFAVLQPINLQVRFPLTGVIIPWDEYLPGYEANEPQLCQTAPGTQISFNNLSANPKSQVIELVFSGPAIELADTIELNIADVSKYPGWSGNAGTSTDNDFSFAASAYLDYAAAAVSGGQAVVTIHCNDYGAFAKLNVTLYWNCLPIHPNPIPITLPLDTNADHIADSWQRREVKRWNKQFRLKPSDPDWVSPDLPENWGRVFGTLATPADAELANSDGEDGPMPAMVANGDGLNVLEEYRGFFLDGGPGATTPKHRRLSAARKELLVECSEEQGISSPANLGQNSNPAASQYSLQSLMATVSAFYNGTIGADIDLYWCRDDFKRGGTVNYGTPWTLQDHPAFFKDGVPLAYDVTNPPPSVGGYANIHHDNHLFQNDQPQHDLRYGKDLPTVIVRGHPHMAHENRNDLLGRFVKLNLLTRSGVVYSQPAVVHIAANSNLAFNILPSGTPDPEYQGSFIYVNSIAEEGLFSSSSGVQYNGALYNGTQFAGVLAWATAHELSHMIRNANGSTPGSLMGSTPRTVIGAVSFINPEIQQINLRARLSIKN